MSERKPSAKTIGAVCQELRQEFPTLSISKIRYLESKHLLKPKRTTGRYRVYSETDVARLRAILQFQRDQFMPLETIRKQLTTRNAREQLVQTTPVAAPELTASETLYTLAEVLADTNATEQFVKELEEYGVISGQIKEGKRYYDEVEREIVRIAVELARYGVGARNLRIFRTLVDRQTALLTQIFSPVLKANSVERKREAVTALADGATTVNHLCHLLLTSELRKLTATVREKK